MKYDVFYKKAVKRDIKLIISRGYNIGKFEKIVDLLREGKKLPSKHKDHALSGNYAGYRKCHIESDWLLIYKIENETLTLVLSRTGTHSDLF